MMFRKRTSTPEAQKNPEGLDKGYVTALRKYLGRLDTVDSQLAADAARYIIDGTDEAVLLRLGGRREVADALGLTPPSTGAWQQWHAAQSERAKLWHPDHALPPAVTIRLAHFFDAVSRAAGHVPQTPPGWPTWLATLGEAWLNGWQYALATKQKTPFADLEAVLQCAGVSTSLAASAVLDPKAGNSFPFWAVRQGNSGLLKDVGQYLARHIDAVREALAHPDAESRLHALRILNAVGFEGKPLVDLLAQLGTGTAKTVREAALPILHTCQTEARPLLERILADGDTGQRHEAALVLWRLCGHDAQELLRQHLASESSERVRQTIEKLLAAPNEMAEDSSAELRAGLPPLRVETGTVPLPAAAKDALRQHLDRGFAKASQAYEQAVAQWNAPNRPKWMRQPTKPAPPDMKALQNVIRFVETGDSQFHKPDQTRQMYFGRGGSLAEVLSEPGVQLGHVVRLSYAAQRLNMHGQTDSVAMWWHNTADLEAFRGRSPEKFGLRELDAVVATLPGARPGLVANAYLQMNNRWNTFCDWESEAIWPIFAEQPDILQGLLGPAPDRSARWSSRDHWWPDKRRTAFRVLAMFPQLPAGFVSLLWDLALGDSKADRPLAQAALATVPNKAPRIQVALADGKQTTRAAAAEWLGKIGDPAAIGPLKEAFAKEKQEIVRGAIMTALDALGADVNEFLDRDALLAEAKAGLGKKRPKGMDWVPLGSLPTLHWADTGKPVEPAIVQWWVVQGIQQKNPVAGPLLRRYLALCRPHEAAALARFVLSTWIGQDTITPTHEQAAEKARAEADRMWAQWGSQQYFQKMYEGKKENLYRQLLQKFTNELLGSAIDQKGMLSLVSATGDADCVKLCEQYIRKWFGYRLAQCKALVEVLAWIRHPLAIQVLLGLANRFRTKAIRQLANEHVQALAEREGWTVDELADRTIPDAGFARPVDEDGAPVGNEATLLLDYGPRQFTVRLNDALVPVIASGEGKTVKNLPAPGKQDDADKAKAARKLFSDARKATKEVVKRQTERLYEALCTQRSWRFDDWRRYLADHPIVGKLCTRLAWAVFSPADADARQKYLGCFRPLEDGSLTNEKDEEATFPDDAVLRLAHPCNTSAAVGEAWQRHFEDYDVTPLFPQFGRTTYTLPEAKQNETQITDFEGHALTTFQLRGKATKLGYLRGEAEDGGCFTVYRKPFPSLGMQAVLSFTGSALPEEDRPAALLSLSFTNLKGDREVSYWQTTELPLGKVPPVLLSECYNDVRQIAAEGSGYDPEWQKKSYF